MTTFDPAVVAAYREHLLPLVRRWRARAARVAIFGTGPHTADLLTIVPELESLRLVAYIESDADGTTSYRGTPVMSLGALASMVDVVVCSSYRGESGQLRLLDDYPVKAYLSHPSHVSAAGHPAFLMVPTYGYPVILPPAPDEHVEVLVEMFDRQLDEFRGEVETLEPFFPELNDVPAEQVDESAPFWNNHYFSGDDARVAYAMTRAYRPRRIIEVGSGNSTKFIRRAITKNGGGTRLISIDPSPRAGVDTLCDEVIRRPLQRVDVRTFDALEPGDFLFMDGTHQVFAGTDSTFFYLRVLPRIAPGVRVHIHDIALPFEYPDEFAGRYYAEQYVLAALLLGGDAWRTTAPVSYLHRRGLLAQGGGSFWMERTSQHWPRPSTRILPTTSEVSLTV